MGNKQKKQDERQEERIEVEQETSKSDHITKKCIIPSKYIIQTDFLKVVITDSFITMKTNIKIDPEKP